MSFPDDCGECRVCGAPVFGSMGVTVCASCEIPRDTKGRFVKRPELPPYPKNGDRVEIRQYTAMSSYYGFATVLEDHWEDDINTDLMLVETETGEHRMIHAGYMKVVTP